MTYAFDAELAPWVPTIPALDYHDLPTTRAILAHISASQPADTSGVHVGTHRVAGTVGQPDTVVRVYRPVTTQGNRAAALLYLHWGGYVTGNLDTVHATALRLSCELDAVVVNVDYRLAPEHRFPAALLDCYAALLWVREYAPDLGVDPNRIGVAGESAGGGLAAALTLLARDRGGPPIGFQSLVYPQLDDGLDTVSARQFVDTPKWDRSTAQLSWHYYLGPSLDGDVSPYAAPARADDLSNLPPAFVSVCEFDPLRDEGLIYAHRLIQAGVPTELHHYPGTFHGSLSITDAAITRRMLNDQTESLRRAMRTTIGELR
ncbi:alpha/beta hydrolase [Nocardia transvalensis]|uniref:alpha/beta hydrolase n=1 Tax=Nocardia transvalensis TaxID=37333 RepID=UPI001893DD8E|nr:alpha/beta hydrolase [Nocardia transvalensis]MBF6328249.1 alpha/beta hydrolase [Nocardia transvalensis]